MELVMNGDDPDYDVEKMYIPDEYARIFAELIIEECAQIASDCVLMRLPASEMPHRIRAFLPMIGTKDD